MQSPDTGVLSGYNARSWTWQQTASYFVAPAQYWQLIDGGDNQRLVGPRGTGKTTLLKMLCGQALDCWQDRPDETDAERARNSIDFTGVFVPADRMWSGQVAALTAKLDPDARIRFGLAAFTFMALRALVETAEYRVAGLADGRRAHRHVDLDIAGEAEIVRHVAEAFEAPRGSASLRSLRVAASENVAGLGRMLRRLGNAAVDEAEVDTIHASPLLDVDFVSAAVLFCQMFDDVVGDSEGAWAFMVDEVEFLPLGARMAIADAFRGHDPKLRFKVSLAPWTDLAPHLEGMPFNDFTPVDLMPPHREAAHAFARRLFAREIELRDRPETPLELLGPGGFESDPGEDSYAPGGENAETISQLADLDEEFRRWLTEQVKLDLADLTVRTDAQYAQLRKAAPLARLRLAFWKAGPTGPVGRSRKRPPDLYSGAQSIWAMSEGNPRWLKAFAHELFARHQARGPAPAHVQIEAATRVADNYLGYFRTLDVELPGVGQPRDGSGRMTPFELLEQMGEYFRARVHSAEFSADPVTMARPDTQDKWIEGIVNSLVFLGGLVRDSDSDGVRIRLAHMFAPHFHLPPRGGRAVPLSVVLGRTGQLSLTDPSNGGQLSLTDELPE